MFSIKDKVSTEERYILENVAAAAADMHVPAFAIGGYVRDLLLGRPCKDIDIVCEGSGIELAKKTAGLLSANIHVSYFKNFGTAMFHYNGIDVEFVGARKESYRRESRKPIVEDGTIEDDQNRRDFTINALAIALSGEDFGNIVDPFNGLADLENGIIRTPLTPTETFDDDPLRMMRAIRFATQLNFKIEHTTYKAIEPLKERIKIVSQERIIDEINKIVMTEKPSLGFKHLFNTGLLQVIFPEMARLQGVAQVENYGHKDNFYHTLKVLDNVVDRGGDLWLRWAAILHDIAKPNTQRFEEGHGWTFHGHDAVGARMVPKIFTALKLPLNEKMKFVQKLVALHLRPISLTKENITDSAIRRLIVEADEDLEALLLLCEADITSKNPEKVRKYTKNLQLVKQKIEEVEERDRLRNWQPPISGELIMQTFGLTPCKEVGIIKNFIREGILDGDIRNEYHEAYEFMIQKGLEIGLTVVPQNA
ncbi:MAG: CCA tRNA nucleotidyltransferase [Chitinophagales bacterium]|nr:CCA tRNA nucleotidyltransferase [Chitinophagales bacterium]